MDLSLEFGAFLSGYIMSKTPYVRQIIHAVEPLHSIFGGMYFAAIGTLMSVVCISVDLFIIK